MKLFFENISFDSLQSTGNDSPFWTTKARFARAGVQEYSKYECIGWKGVENIPGGIVRVYRPEDVVFDARAMKSFEHVPMTVEHEDGLVTGENAKGIVVGAASYPVTREGDALVVPVTIYDANSVIDAKTGRRRQLSAAYDFEAEYKPGVHEVYGAYDYIMTSWTGNHITLTKAGKAGPDYYVGDKMAEKTAEVTPKPAEAFVARVVDGISYPMTEQGAQVFDRVCGERDAALAEVKTLKESALTEEEISKRVADGLAVMDSVRKIDPEAKIDNKTTEVVILDAVKKAYPDLSVDGKSSEYVRALFDSAVARAGDKTPDEDVNDRALDGANPKPTAGTFAAARAEFIAKNSGRR